MGSERSASRLVEGRRKLVRKHKDELNHFSPRHPHSFLDSFFLEDPIRTAVATQRGRRRRDDRVRDAELTDDSVRPQSIDHSIHRKKET